MICITETASIALRMAVATGGIDSRGITIHEKLTAQLEKELLAQYKPLKYINGKIDGEEVRFIWLDTAFITPRKASEYDAYLDASTSLAPFLPHRREYSLSTDHLETASFIEAALTTDPKIINACISPQGQKIFSWLYDKYNLAQLADCIRVAPTSAEHSELIRAFNKKQHLSKGETQKQIQSNLALDEVFWLITVNLALAYNCLTDNILTLDARKFSILHLLKDPQDYDAFIQYVIEKYERLYLSENELKSSIDRLLEEKYISRNKNNISLSASGREFVDNIAPFSKYVSPDYLMDLIIKLDSVDQLRYPEEIAAIRESCRDDIRLWHSKAVRISSTRLNCPLCQGMLYLRGNTYKCSDCGHQMKKKNYGKILTEDIMEYLLKNGDTPIYKGTDGRFSRLLLKDGQIISTTQTDYACPVCDELMLIDPQGRNIYCERDKLYIPLTYAHHRLTRNELNALIEEGITPLFEDCVDEDGVIFNGAIQIRDNKVVLLEVV